MSDILTERAYGGEFMLSDANGTYTRETVTIGAGQTLDAGAVLGKITIGDASATATAGSGNTGDGTIGSISVADGAASGTWTVSFTAATAFTVTDPDGNSDGTGTTGTAYSGALGFTIAAGSTAFVSGDTFSIAVSYAEGSGEYVAWNPAATDGSATVAGILWDAVETGSDETAKATAVVRGPCEVVGDMLAYDDDITDAEIETAEAALDALGIVIR